MISTKRLKSLPCRVTLSSCFFLLTCMVAACGNDGEATSLSLKQRINGSNQNVQTAQTTKKETEPSKAIPGKSEPESQMKPQGAKKSPLPQQQTEKTH